MNISTRIKKLESATVPPVTYCKCPRESIVLFPSDDPAGDLMTARDILAQREADRYCSQCGLEVNVIRVTHPMCECEANLDLRVDVPDNWYELPDREHWRAYLIAKCGDCGEPIHYGRVTPRVRGTNNN